jgi:hypothetical protein
MLHLWRCTARDSRGVSYETDRMRFIGRGARSPRRGDARRGALSGSQARCSIRSSRSASRHARADQTATSTSSRHRPRRATARSRSSASTRPHLADRVFDSRGRTAWVTLRQINATESDAQLYARLASSVIYANAALRAEPACCCATAAASRAVELRDLRRPADRAAADRRRREHRSRAPARAGACVLAAEGLAVDLVIWNEDRGGYRQLLQDQIMG